MVDKNKKYRGLSMWGGVSRPSEHVISMNEALGRSKEERRKF